MFEDMLSTSVLLKIQKELEARLLLIKGERAGKELPMKIIMTEEKFTKLVVCDSYREARFVLRGYLADVNKAIKKRY